MQPKKSATLFSHFQHVRICGSYLHSKGAYFLNGAVELEHQYQYHSTCQYALDYLSAILCNSVCSNTSYTQTLSKKQVESIQNAIRHCLTNSDTSKGSFLQSIKILMTKINADDITLLLSETINIQILDLSLSNLQTSGAIKIAKSLQNISSLTEFNIADNKIGSEAANDIAIILSYNTNLQIFSISSNNLETSGAIKIAKGLQNITSLKEFYISNNNISSEAADDIAAVISHNNNLQKFYIGSNNIKTSGAIMLLQALQNLSSVLELNISENNIGNEAIAFIEAVLSHNNRMQILGIGGNMMEAAGAMKITRALYCINYLAQLSISFNCTDGSKGANNIYVEMFNRFICILGNNFGAIKTVGTFHCTSSNSDAEASDEPHLDLHNTSKFELCYLCNIKFNTTAYNIIRAFTYNTSSLTIFSITNTYSSNSNKVAKYISDVLSHNTKLQNLRMAGNCLNTSDAIKIAKALQNISTLRELDMSNNMQYW